ncbi:MAG: SDR family oxidoreductase [Acidobacteria bacterium]|nr:SDR family oxidoreductase [Acidobacteriota bacterium]
MANHTRVALLTGGVRGIGRAIAVRLAERGWTIAACYRHSESDAASLQEELQRKNIPVMIERADVSSAEAAAALVQKVEAQFGRLDALINCAGLYHRVALLEESLEGWHEMFDNNLHPVFYLSRAVVPGMIERRWGRIINFSMANADQQIGQPFVTAHYIAKAGVLILTRSLAKVLAAHGITVNAISPGFIDTGSAPADELAKMVKNIPAGYLGDTTDAVHAVCFLLSEEARYINGSNLHLSGAWGV